MDAEVRPEEAGGFRGVVPPGRQSTALGLRIFYVEWMPK
jgi:hypothetical protein